ncbi:MAG: TIGR02530 family flagellar biosynthesis protein [Turicibacter sp.]
MTYRIDRVYHPVQLNSKNETLKKIEQQQFRALYDQAINQELKVSNHALKRLEQRNISLSQPDLQRIDQALKNVELKGGRESLVMYKDLMLVASVKNRTIITVMEQSNQSEEIFTNIDSAVVIK